MQKVIIYGTGNISRQVFYHITKEIEIVGFCETKKTKDVYYGLKVYEISELEHITFDKVIIASSYNEEIQVILNKFGVTSSKIIDYWGEMINWSDDRLAILRNLAEEINRNGIDGAVAELGVFKGDFAKYINESFPDKTLYLYDTFEGFYENEIQQDIRIADSDLGCLESFNETFKQTSVEVVMSKMYYPENCVIRKGYFPQTAVGEGNITYCFVNIDVDLYPPIKAGLEYFWNRLESGGYILIHDFNTKSFPGVRKAVIEFCKKNQIPYCPLSDCCGSVLLMR